MKWLWTLVLIAASGAAAADCGASAQTVRTLRAEPPEEGSKVAVRGVVGAAFGGDRRLDGFYLQSAENPPAGVFVYTPDHDPNALPSAGNRVRVQAQVGAYQGRLQLEWVAGIERCGRARITATPLQLPAGPARLTALEDTLVRTRGELVVTDNRDLGRFGVLHLAVGARLYQQGGRGRPAGVLLDDGNHTRQPRPVPFLGETGTRRIGDRTAPVTGVLDYAFGAWRIHPVEPPHFTNANPRRRPPGREGAWRLAGFNVENYFVTLGSRGAEDAGTLRRQRERLVAAIRTLDADVLALQEIENRSAAVADLIAAVNRDAPPQAHYSAAAAGLARERGVIRTVLLYRPARLTVRDVWLDSASVHDRPPVAAHFVDGSGRGAVVAAVHFKSRGGCPSRGDRDTGEGCWNGRRTAQARALARWTRRLQREATAVPVVVLGDLNAYPGEAPLRVLADTGGLEDLLAASVSERERYTYVYDGRAGLLDHALGNRRARTVRQGAAVWHANADEPAVIAGEGPWRSADHDPVIVDLFVPDNGG